MRTARPFRRNRSGAARRAVAGRIDAGTRDGLAYCVKVFLGVRVALSALALAAVGVLPNAAAMPKGVRTALGIPGPVSVPGWPAHGIVPGWSSLFTAWERFDALWYLRIAAHGYANHDGSAAFFPLFPLVVRGVSAALGGHPLAAGLLVANLCALGALMVLYLFTRDELSEGAARRAVLYIAVFPTAFFFVAPYSEAPFLLLALCCLWAARRDRWWAAGIAGALAALTRNLGVLLVLPMAVEAVLQWREAGHVRVAPLAWSAAPVAGVLPYLYFWHRLAGDWLAPLHQESGWERVPMLPWNTLWHATQDAFRFLGIYPGGYHLLDWLVTVPALAAGVYAATRLRATFGVYTWVSFLAPLCFVFAGRPLMSFPRFVLPVFPVVWALALWTEDHPARHELVVASSAVLLGVLALLFVDWYYVF